MLVAKGLKFRRKKERKNTAIQFIERDIGEGMRFVKEKCFRNVSGNWVAKVSKMDDQGTENESNGEVNLSKVLREKRKLVIQTWNIRSVRNPTN